MSTQNIFDSNEKETTLNSEGLAIDVLGIGLLFNNELDSDAPNV